MKILHVTSSILAENSHSTKLGQAIITKLKEKESDSTVVLKDVGASPLPHITSAFFIPTENRTADQIAAVATSDNAIAELKDANAIVLSVPMYNFSIPSNLKTWIDNIGRVGETFQYTENGPEGLVKGKKVYLAVATGGVYSVDEAKAFDFTESYLRTVLGFLGMTDVTVFRVEGLALTELKDSALEKAIHTVNSASL